LFAESTSRFVQTVESAILLDQTNTLFGLIPLSWIRCIHINPWQVIWGRGSTIFRICKKLVHPSLEFFWYPMSRWRSSMQSGSYLSGVAVGECHGS
jgi:hypothetical protein